jgi:osmotically-inducible protein OsmY
MTITGRSFAFLAGLLLAAAPALAQSAPQPAHAPQSGDSTVTFRGHTGDDRIVPDNPPADGVLATRVRQALKGDPYLDGENIDVEVVHGVALLSNDVRTRFERSRAETVAARVPDIVGVISSIHVAAPDYGARQSDGELLADIRDEIYWNPELSLDDIHVSVDRGTATLTGAVDSYRARGAAQDEALSAGASDVINNITVRRSGVRPGAPSQGA